MLDSFRKLMKGWFGKALVSVLLLPFALFGISSIFQVDQNKKVVVEVNGEGIDERDLLRAMAISKNELVERLGGKISADVITNEMVRPAALEKLINKELLKQFGESNGLDVSMDRVHRMIAEIPAFQEDGQFSQEQYNQVLRRNGLVPERFPEEMKSDLVSQQINNGILATVFASSDEISALLKLNNQQRTFSYAQLNLEDFNESIEIDEQQIAEYYGADKEQFRTEELVSIDYVELKRSDFTDNVLVSDKELRLRYDQDIQSIEENRARKASHILIEINDQRGDDEALKLANSIHQRLIEGEIFSVLATEYSDDASSAKQGGSLGAAGKGAYVKEFEDTLFNLVEEGVSSPVLTEFGYHIIRMDGFDAEVPSFEALKDQLAMDIKLEKADGPYQETYAELENVAYESSDLAEAVLLLKNEVQNIKAFARAGGEGLSVNQIVVDAAFSEEVLNEGRNSGIIDISDDHSIVLRLNEHFESSIKPLNEVRSEIVASLTSEQAKQKVKDVAEESVSLLRGGASSQAISEKFGLVWQDFDKVMRNDPQVPRAVLKNIFEQPKPPEGAAYFDEFMLDSGDVVVMILSEVAAADEKSVSLPASDKPEETNGVVSADVLQYQQIEQILENQKANISLQAFHSWLRQEADVK
ncbi:MAG: SurA N-terminal domain-containing protein [Gammaproteobacteria bacterium]|nr:SurA N-terminal domain-containing protein [Gammaproteobacteria bacterium]